MFAADVEWGIGRFKGFAGRVDPEKNLVFVIIVVFM